jgi:hypothetical protein
MKTALSPRVLSKEDPRRVFESFVCSPLPRSVGQVKATGTIALAGGNVFIEFQLDPEDHDDLIRRGRFQPADERDSSWIMELQPDGVKSELRRYVRVNEGMTETALFISEDLRRAWFREIHF